MVEVKILKQVSKSGNGSTTKAEVLAAEVHAAVAAIAVPGADGTALGGCPYVVRRQYGIPADCS